jgi:hypothetical protein
LWFVARLTTSFFALTGDTRRSQEVGTNSPTLESSPIGALSQMKLHEPDSGRPTIASIALVIKLNLGILAILTTPGPEAMEAYKSRCFPHSLAQVLGSSHDTSLKGAADCLQMLCKISSCECACSKRQSFFREFNFPRLLLLHTPLHAYERSRICLPNSKSHSVLWRTTRG